MLSWKWRPICKKHWKNYKTRTEHWKSRKISSIGLKRRFRLSEGYSSIKHYRFLVIFSSFSIKLIKDLSRILILIQLKIFIETKLKRAELYIEQKDEVLSATVSHRHFCRILLAKLLVKFSFCVFVLLDEFIFDVFACEGGLALFQ